MNIKTGHTFIWKLHNTGWSKKKRFHINRTWKYFWIGQGLQRNDSKYKLDFHDANKIRFHVLNFQFFLSSILLLRMRRIICERGRTGPGSKARTSKTLPFGADGIHPIHIERNYDWDNDMQLNTLSLIIHLFKYFSSLV